MSDIPTTILGNVVSDVRSISTRSGATLSSFRRQLADHVLVSLRRGDPVLVIGRLRVREWSNEDKSGVVVEIDATSVGHDLTRGTSTFSRFRREQAEDEEELTALDPWTQETAERLVELANAAGVTVESMDSTLLDGANGSERKSA